MMMTMKYCIVMPNRGLLLKPKGEWDEIRAYLFIIKGYSDSEYLKSENRYSVNVWLVFLYNAPISYKSEMMHIVAMLFTEAALFAAVQCA
eukprot:6476883-Ditylum_brightwellii.AAC.2